MSSVKAVVGVTELRMPWNEDCCASHVTPQGCTWCWHFPGWTAEQSIKEDGFFPKLLKAYPDDTNSCTTNTSQVHLFLGFQIQKDQLVPGNIQDGLAVQKL